MQLTIIEKIYFATPDDVRAKSYANEFDVQSNEPPYERTYEVTADGLAIKDPGMDDGHSMVFVQNKSTTHAIEINGQLDCVVPAKGAMRWYPNTLDDLVMTLVVDESEDSKQSASVDVTIYPK